MLPGIAVLLALAPPPIQKAGSCALIDRATVVALLGPAGSAGTQAPPEPDEDTGGTLSYCTFRSGTGGLILSKVTFATAAAALKATTKELVSSRMEGDGATIADETGLGDKAYWAYTSEGAEFVVVKGSVVVAVALGGQLPNPPASYRKALRAATSAALLKL